jgi:hypothetical protein
MARTKKGAPVAELLPDIKVGDRVVITAEGPGKGRHDAVVEINHETSEIRLAGVGWLKRDDVEVLDGPIPEAPAGAQSPAQRAPSRRRAAKEAAAGAPDVAAGAFAEAEDRGEFQTLVDGKDAKVVLDGKTGTLVDEAMIKPSLDDLVRSLARAHEALEHSTLAKKRTAEQCKDDQGAVNAIVAEIIEHYGHATQLSLGINGAAGKATRSAPEDEEEEDGDNEVWDPAGGEAGARPGVRDYSGGEGPE